MGFKDVTTSSQPGQNVSASVTVQQAATYVCRNNDIGDGTPCPWFERPRTSTRTGPRMGIGQGLFMLAIIQCECGSTLHDQGEG
jgi:hypothetical protein